MRSGFSGRQGVIAVAGGDYDEGVSGAGPAKSMAVGMGHGAVKAGVDRGQVKLSTY